VPYPDYTKDELTGTMGFIEPAFPFRKTFCYQNHGFMLAGRVVERVSGMEWEDFIQDNILDPLGMKNTYTRPSRIPPGASLSIPYNPRDGELFATPHLEIGAMGPAGSILSSAEDILKWLKVFLFDEGPLQGERKNILECIKPQFLAPPELFDFKGITRCTYGLGWWNELYRDREVLKHGGTIDGYRFIMSFMPAEKIAVVCMTNTLGSPVPDVLPLYVYDAYFEDGFEDHFAVTEAKPEEAAEVQHGYTKYDNEKAEEYRLVESEKAEALVGRYVDPGFGKIEIFREEEGIAGRMGAYALKIRENEAGDLKLLFPNTMMTLEATPFTGILEYDGDGYVRSISLDIEPPIGHPVRFVKENWVYA
jgi:CubicO group peptidase (beta-lactamase class C family)